MTHLDPLPPTEASMPAVHVVELTANPHAKVRLFCFPFAGAGIQTFRAWAQALDPSIQVLALLLPGRENKIREPAFLRWQDLLAATFRAMQPHLNGKPFVFFGHSFGGRIAFELILQLEQCGMRLPVHFIVSGCRSPNWPNKRPFLHDLSHVEFRQALVQLDGTPEQVLREPALMRMLEPTLRADMRLAERWLRQATKISVPITAFSAVDDAIDPPDRMLDWQQATHGAFAFREFHGGHFYWQKFPEQVCQAIDSLLLESCAKYPCENEVPDELDQEIAGSNCLIARFEAHAQYHGGATAIITRDATLTYGELNEKANQWAHYLRSRGTSHGDVVALVAHRSLDTIALLLAIVKLGAAYLPIDPALPSARLQTMLDQAGVRTIVTAGQSATRFTGFAQRIVDIDAEATQADRCGTDNLRTEISPNDRIYINYTSGSTGAPKGVSIAHRGVRRLLLGTNYATFDASSVFLQLAPMSFDAATFEIWGPLVHGGKCVLFEGSLPTIAALDRAINDNGVNILFLTTALFNTILDQRPTILSGIKQLLSGGEAHSVAHMKKALRLLANTKLSNVYGPTEATTFSTFYHVEAIDDSATSIAIGCAICQTSLYILDENQRPVTPGQAGELYIGGPGIALEYIGAPEATAAAFISGLDFLESDVRLYRTGDWVRQLSDGNLDFLGRRDAQIKLRGFRIELGEIEQALRGCPGVAQASVVVSEGAQNSECLVAFVVAHDDEAQSIFDAQVVAVRLAETLPHYMLPARYQLLSALPLTAHGKVDRAALRHASRTLEHQVTPNPSALRQPTFSQ